IEKAHGSMPGRARQDICLEFLPALEEAVERHPDDVEAREAQVYALWQLGHLREALAALEAALAKAPRSEVALNYAIRVADALGENDQALAYCRRLLRVNPWDAEGRYIMAYYLGQRRQWQEAIRECRAALRLNPGMIDARKILVMCYVQK